MIQLLIAILLGLASPLSTTNTPSDGTVVTTNATTNENPEDGTGGGTGTGGDNGQLPPPPLTGR